ncbi:MAG: hypothetical protein NDI69_04670 [Bacteriovoracaceae bacterium]|nr:hypothetical protein [Bacteriovoracaceae bacterium]
MSDWELDYSEWNPKQEGLNETLCTLGNGYFATRGAREEASCERDRYAGTYLGGGFNRADSVIEGKIIENEDLVNWPDWTSLNLRIKNGDWFSLDRVEILKFHQQLDMKSGVLNRTILFRTHDMVTCLETKRFVSMDNPHVAGISWIITPRNWEGEVEVKSMIDGSVTNNGIARYRQLNGKHLKILDTGLSSEDSFYLLCETRESQIMMAQVVQTRVYENKCRLPIVRESFFEHEKAGQLLKFKCRNLKSVRIEKMVTLYTSHDFAISHPLKAARNLNNEMRRFDDLLKAHKEKWKSLWGRFNISLKGMSEENKILRLHIFHLLQTVSHNSIGRDVSVPSRGLHGEAYRGHIFWDETFIFPFIYFRMPELARSLLMYRYRRLDVARRLAKEEGLEGAMFPWQSGSDGREESQKFHLNPESGRWIPDNTHRQRHINGAIVYNIFKYFQVTNDREFISLYGTEIVLEIAQFWVSLAEFNPKKKRYEIKGIVGPDEFHTQYPEVEQHGLNNNAYTNYMASWSIRKALELLEPLAESRKNELLRMVGVTEGDLVHWEHVGRNIYIPFQKDGIISQFEGFEELKDFNWEKYHQMYEDLQRLDRILEAEGDSINRYKVNKQGDVLMLFYLFSAEEITEGFAWMGYEFKQDLISKNILYYLGHTSSGSSLSRIVHAWVLSRSDRKHSWRVFQEALMSDLSDIQGGTTSEGIHLGAMSGTVDIVQRCFTGMEMHEGILWFNPMLPDELKGIELTMRYQGHWISVDVDHENLKITIDRSWESEGKLGFRGKIYKFQEGSFFNFSMKGDYHQKELS